MTSTMDNKEDKTLIKMSGYLEKKTRKKMMSCYKKYWFVLEGRLLLYYRSKDEYDAISPCKGSVNLGPTCNLKPCAVRVGVFQIVNRTSTITLRANSREEQHKWMQAIMTALNQNCNPTKLNYFRYSLGELSPEPKKPLERQNTMPERLSLSNTSNNSTIIEKVQRIGGQSYVNFSPQKMPFARSSSAELSSRDSFFVENVEYEASQNNGGLYERIPSRDDVFKSHRPETILMENANYSSASNCKEEMIYAEPNYTEIDYNDNSMKPNSTHEYAEAEYVKISSGSCESLNADKVTSKKHKGFGKKNKPPKDKLKKSESFLQRVWKKKNKNKRNKIIEPITIENNLTELELSDSNTIQMLSTLQSVLESKKQQISKTPRQNSKENDMEETNLQLPGAVTENTEPNCPRLPPRNTKSKDDPLIQELLTKTDKTSKQHLDDILQDLDKQQSKKTDNVDTRPREGNVKDLIRRFSEEIDVELRLKKKWRVANSARITHDRDSNELNRLLNELAEVTNAPIMTPGVTTSLVNPEMPDIEFLKMIPIRRRRMSDPDYDVPRSHKSLINTPKKDEYKGTLTGTRFFGPVLNPCDINSMEAENGSKSATSTSNLLSMTPDSLEMDMETKKTNFSEESNTSYQSHDYVNFQRSEFIIENCLYSEPRLLMRLPSQLNQTDNKISNDSDLFIDSLEVVQ